MSKNNKKNQIDDLVNSLNREFGSGAGSIGSVQKALNSVPTGSLALDYALGVGGWPLGHLVGVYGRRDIGKSSVVGLNAIRSAQSMGLNCAIVAVEPGFDPAWAEKHGVDTENLVIARPKTGEEAFAMLYKLVNSEIIDLVIFDSLGAILAESEIDEGGKMKQGGQAGLITWGVKRVAPIAYRNNVCVILINQVRDNMQSRIPGIVSQPGGHALEHMETIIVQLKPGKDRYTLKIDGQDVVIGQSIVAHIQRNKLAEGTGQKAVFDFYQKETDEYPFGIDQTSDIIATGKRTGVIKQAGAYYDMPNGQRLQGQKAVAKYLDENPEVLGMIRDGIMKAMMTRNSKTKLEAVGDE